MNQLNWISSEDVMPELEEAIAKGDKKAVGVILRKLKRNLKELKKEGIVIPNSLEWFYSIVPFELLSEDDTNV